MSGSKGEAVNLRCGKEGSVTMSSSPFQRPREDGDGDHREVLKSQECDFDVNPAMQFAIATRERDLLRAARIPNPVERSSGVRGSMLKNQTLNTRQHLAEMWVVNPHRNFEG